MEFVRKGSVPVMELRDGVIPYLKFPALEKTGIIKHGFSTRMGGVSTGYLESMNLGFARGDDTVKVRENYRRILGAMNIPPDSAVLSKQVHKTDIRKATSEDRGKGIFKELDYDEVDGLITNEPDICLVTLFADCVPLYFVDPVHRAIGLAHSGWKGTVKRMGKHMVDRMAKEYGSKPEELIGAIGPSICKDCYEVSEEVAEQFAQTFSNVECDLIFRKKTNGKYLLDLWKANAIIMKDAGMKQERISVTDLCTSCNPRILFSHRASGGKRGNLAAFLYLNRE